MATCQRTALSHLAGLPLPRARISQAFITYSLQGVLFPDYALTSWQTKISESWGWKQPPHIVLMPFSIPRAGIFVGKGVRGPCLQEHMDEYYSILRLSLFNPESK